MNKLKLYYVCLKVRIMQYFATMFRNWSLKLMDRVEFINLGMVREEKINDTGEVSILVRDVVDIKSKWKIMHNKLEERKDLYAPNEFYRISK